MSHPTKAYTKPAKPTAELLSHWQSKGLVVTDVQPALSALQRIGYYRLLIYSRPLQEPTKRFRANTTFDDIVTLYNFDRQLRLLCLDAIEKIEVALRAAIVEKLAVAHGPHFYTEVRHFQEKGGFVEFINTAARTNYLAIDHYYSNYNQPSMPPIWALLEAVMFGDLSKLYSNLHVKNRKSVALAFGYDEEPLRSWFRSLNLLRNKCAHHNRLWNATLAVDTPRPAKPLRSVFANPTTLYARLVVIVAMLDKIEPGCDWKSRLKSLIAATPLVDPTAMGFISGWEAKPFWR